MLKKSYILNFITDVKFNIQTIQNYQRDALNIIYSSNIITNVMHWILFIRQILLLSSTCSL